MRRKLESVTVDTITPRRRCRGLPVIIAGTAVLLFFTALNGADESSTVQAGVQQRHDDLLCLRRADVQHAVRCDWASARSRFERAVPMPNELPAFDQTQTKARNHCTKQAADPDFDMQVFCERKQKHAIKELMALKDDPQIADIPTATYNSVVNHCDRLWGRANDADYDMILYCVQEEIAALRGLKVQ
jgi:hypothetical protein